MTIPITFTGPRIFVHADSVDAAREIIPDVRVIEKAQSATGKRGVYEAPNAPRTHRILRSMGVAIPDAVRDECDEWLRQIRQIAALRARLHEGDLPDLSAHVTPDTSLRRVQSVGALIALSAKRTALYMDMGTGKTLTSLVACAHRFQNHGLRRVLVIAPATVAGGWRGDIGRLAMADQVEFVHATGSQGARRRAYDRAHLVGNGDDYMSVVAISYGSIANDAPELMRRFKPQAVIVDESHYIKNGTNGRSRAVQYVCDGAEFVTLLTGTPYSEKPTDVFHQYAALDWRVFGASRNQFVAQFCGSKPNYAASANARVGDDGERVMPAKISEGDASQNHALSSAIYTIGFRARKDDVLDLPEKHEPQRHHVALSAKTNKMIDDLRVKGLADLDDAIGKADALASMIASEESRVIDATPGEGRPPESKILASAVSGEVIAAALDLVEASDKQRAGVKPTIGGMRALLSTQRVVVASTKMVIGLRVQQAAGGFANIEEVDDQAGETSKSTVQIGTEKLDALRDLVTSMHEERESVVVFARFRAEIAAIEDRLRKVYGEVNVSRIDGSVPTAKRSGIVEAFQVPEGPPRAMVLQVSSGAAGITLTRARHAIYYSLGYSATDYWQSRDRIHRIGQDRACFYHIIEAVGSDDATVLSSIEGKTRIADAVIESWRAEMAGVPA